MSYWGQPWRSAWFVPCYLIASDYINTHPEDGERTFVADILDRLAMFGWNLATAGALCAAHQIGADPPVTYHLHQTQLRHITFTIPDVWYPGCQRPVTAPEDGWEP